MRETVDAVHDWACSIRRLENTPVQRITMGIDPGADGAISIICNGWYKLASVFDIPTFSVPMKNGKRTTEYDYRTISCIFNIISKNLNPCAWHVGLETGIPYLKGNKGSTAYTGFRCGWSIGIWPLYLTSLHIKVKHIRPAEWKNKFKLQKKGKAASLGMARRLFEGCVPLLQRKKDHNRAEALLLAHYTHQQVLLAKE
jgi:hypothetical protein